MAARHLHGIALLASLLLAAAGVAAGCSNDNAGDAGAPLADASAGADARSDDDARGDTRDSSSDAAADAGRSAKDANGPGEAGAQCSFNRDCQLALRCVCNGSCSCAPGARGTGGSGIDGCDSGNDCASAVCLEGPSGAFVCSDECETAASCPAKLPRCEDIAFVGRICVRQP